MKLSVVQTNPEFGEIKKNIIDAIELMSSISSDFFVLPELFSTGYNFIDKTEVEKLSENIFGFTYQKIFEFAKKKNCYVCYGFAENENGKFFNSSLIVNKNGIVGHYRKVHLFYKEKIFFEFGNLGFPIFETEFGKIGMMICFDWYFPESARTLALKGANLILHPSNLVMEYCPNAMITRCLENKIFSATANRVGKEFRGENNFTFIGLSEIVSPNGNILCRLGNEFPEIATVEIDLRQAENKKINELNDLFFDRKKNFYEL